VPPDVLLLQKHSGNDAYENYREELCQFCKERGLGHVSITKAHSIFRGERIANSEWFARLSFPEDTALVSSMKNLSI
jgi:hypothetical protein